MPVQISVNGYQVSPARVTLGTAGSVTDETLVFSFSSEWDGLLKRITFRACGHENAVPFFIPDDGVLPVPPQALAESGYHPAVIDGVGTDGTVLYTVEIGFEVLYHPDAGTQPPPGYTPDEYQQFIQLVQNDRLLAQDAAQDARDAANTYPHIRSGTWWVYDPDLGEYVDTGVPSTGTEPILEEATNEDIDNIFKDLGVQKRRF